MNDNLQEISTEEKNIKIKQAAKMMGKSEQFVRIRIATKQTPIWYRRQIKYTMDISYITTTLL